MSILVCMPYKGADPELIGGHNCIGCKQEVFATKACVQAVMHDSGMAQFICVHCAALSPDFDDIDPKFKPVQIAEIAKEFGVSYEEAESRVVGFVDVIKAEFAVRRLIAKNWVKKFRVD
jgi:hypothetical protein